MSEKSRAPKNLALLRLAGVCGIVGSMLSLIMVLSATFLSLQFSWNVNALSDLGIGEQAALFNSALLIGGTLNLLFALGLYHHLDNKKMITAGIVLIMVGSFCLALVGVFTISYLVLHGIVAFGYFMMGPIGFLLIGFGTNDRVIKNVSFVCGIAALLAILTLPVLMIALSFKIGFAVPELIESLIISGWTVHMSTRLIIQSPK